MSVTTRKTIRRTFESTVPVLTPLYNSAFAPRTLGSEGHYLCGTSDSCDLRLRSDGIEPEHCSLILRAGMLSVRRRDGRVWVNDLPIGSECQLDSGDVLSVGPLSFLVDESAGSAKTPASTKRPSRDAESLTELSASERLARKAEELAERESALSDRSNDVAEQHQSQTALSQSLALRSAELESQAAALAQRSDAFDVQALQVSNATSSVEQLTVVAAEREAAVRAQQEAHAAKQEARQTIAINEARSAVLSASEARLAKLQEAARNTVRAADAEREALQNGHKDLLCERNSLMQRSQDLSNRESGLTERESVIAKQAEELRSRFDALQLQSTDVRKEESELNSRSAEVHRRVTQFKCEVTAHRLQLDVATATASATEHGIAPNSDIQQIARLTESLDESETQCAAATAERDALLTAVREMQRALENARTDAEEAAHIRSRSADQEQTIAHLYQSLEVRRQEQQLSESRLMQSIGNRNFGAAEAETALLEEIESLRLELNQSASADPRHQNQFSQTVGELDETVRRLQSELESARNELDAFNAASVAATDQSRVSADELRSLRMRVEDNDELLQGRDHIIRDLQARLLEQTQTDSSASFDSEGLQHESRELDCRASLLDQRDRELIERTRRIEQSEGEVEGQRRQLLDARQQLELARAEIQTAMKQHTLPAVMQSFSQPPIPLPLQSSGSVSDRCSAPRFDGPSGLGFHTIASVQRSFGDSDDDAGGETGSVLRSELASLFSLRKQSSEPQSESPSPVTEFVDLSEAAGESNTVAFRFGEDASRIVESVMAADARSLQQEEVREENSDDFVRDYMEQLLSRSRKTAGNTLPSELKAAVAKPAVQSAAASAQKKGSGPASKSTPKVNSFIEQYMSGGFGDLTGDGSMPARPEPDMSAVEPDDLSTPQIRPDRLTPRVRVDVQKLRENMVSLRSVSTQSVENALVNHAQRQQRHAINGRIACTAVLLVMSVFLAVANTNGVVNHSLITSVTMIAAIATSAELARTLYNAKKRIKSVLMPDDPNAVKPDHADILPETGDRSSANATAGVSE